ncbi:unnamed protein product (mitochondrion) [Plasmodiophora brassicae]|uniref:Uncharacterized protein n=1 Tax=Plasmodiophora brassicae TaxID=37360 RepID=A0A0G4J540_PLABS|nr:hypothetical protein PBRA_002579 [Plasmodiophora brassicae]SPQ94742.1 unnamed protein product [Plasmodiophora brassicae]
MSVTTAILLCVAVAVDSVIIVDWVSPQAYSKNWVTFDPRVGSLNEFLSAWAPSTTKRNEHPWIYVKSPATNGSVPVADISGLQRGCRQLMAMGAFTKGAVLALAVQHNVLTGKWMPYPVTAVVDTVWARLAREVHGGRLGIAIKVAPNADGHPETTNSGDRPGRQNINVYTKNFTDVADVAHVRQQLNALGITEPIGYKPDAYTYCGVYPGNEWGIDEEIYRA